MPIRRTYLVDEYRRDAVNQNVGAAVHVEVGWDHDDDALAEIRWLETLDKSPAWRFAISATLNSQRLMRRGARPPIGGEPLRRCQADVELASDRADEPESRRGIARCLRVTANCSS